ncbi:MAG: hypothetical protein KBT87_13010 [Gammaproteobacteria bacterium]|jgi:predicted transcriptional regulator|nr:hypothetical protein [Gammaproteobacteria bacterium]MBQ0775589.1 hypothetical protein [Gammaproteobacteria bacterium]|tara:strand:- start:56395 stop:56661 length:267 start_codon:yes stop_codon:yes gene_type:complete
MEEMEQAEDEFAMQALVEAVENQISDGHPREAGLVMLALTSSGVEHEVALEQMADVLAYHISVSLEKSESFDVNAYARDLLKLSEGDE